MSEAQVFQVLGIAYTAIGIGAVADSKSFGRLVEGFAKERALLFVSGILALVTGYCLVVFYGGIWGANRSTVLVCIGYAALLKAIMMLAMPEWSIKVMKAFMKIVPNALYGWFVLVLGMAFLAIGYGMT